MSLRDLYLITALRVEWAKSRARSKRWLEEHQLLIVEIERTIVFFKNRSGWWASRAKLRPVADAELAEGLCAFASQQAAIQYQRGEQVASLYTSPETRKKDGARRDACSIR